MLSVNLKILKWSAIVILVNLMLGPAVSAASSGNHGAGLLLRVLLEMMVLNCVHVDLLAALVFQDTQPTIVAV